MFLPLLQLAERASTTVVPSGKLCDCTFAQGLKTFEDLNILNIYQPSQKAWEIAKTLQLIQDKDTKGTCNMIQEFVNALNMAAQLISD